MKTRVWRGILAASALAVLSIVAYVAYTVLHYMHTSPRFAVRNVSVVGIKRVEETLVLRKAGVKSTANVFSVDLEDVRERIEGLKWVRYATVQRLLPDTIAIKIVERSPAGLAQVGGQILQFDAQGVLLNRERGSGADFPILHGLTSNDPELNQKKVDLYIRIMDELHGKDELSEVQIDDAFDVSVISQTEPVLVTLGEDHFRERWGLYLQLRTKIQAEHPDTVQVDFRFKNQAILRTKIEGDASDDERKVLWDTEKISL